MARQYGKDYIYLVWKEPMSRRQYTIAKLSKNGKYEFKYDFDIKEAMDKGFELLVAFNDIDKTYESDRLFASFSSRIPDRRRKDIDKILNKYKLSEYNEYELLKKSGGKLPIDNLEFIDPIINNGENPIKRSFYIAGTRHYLGCKGNECVKSLDVNLNERLYLNPNPNNKYDKYAIEILNEGKKLIGYIPRYYSEELSKLLENGANYSINICEINKEANCNECLKVNLDVHLNY